MIAPFKVTFKSPNTEPPKFYPTLKDVVVSVNQSYTLALPEPVDFDNDGWRLESFEVNPNIDFIEGDFPTFELFPTKNS